jgi:ATP-dependent Clp protease adaptor protein ClpS
MDNTAFSSVGKGVGGPHDKMGGLEHHQTAILIKSKPKAESKKPPKYKVLLLNDDFTPMEFVVNVLKKFFDKGYEEATYIMLQVHQKGVGVCGVYVYDIAEMKVTHVNEFSRHHGFPLQCTMEKE